jgi:tryptophan-rich sensory protein
MPPGGQATIVNPSTLGRLVICLLVPQLVGITSGLLTVSAVRDWYVTLARPSFTPPSWVFGPVWTAIYLLMGIAAFLVWQRGLGAPFVRTALSVFAVQLLLNGLWSVLFFALRSPGIALVEILVLWALIAWCMMLFFRVRAVAGALLVPYLAWVTFATALNFEFWRLNRGG